MHTKHDILTAIARVRIGRDALRFAGSLGHRVGNLGRIVEADVDRALGCERHLSTPYWSRGVLDCRSHGTHRLAE